MQFHSLSLIALLVITFFLGLFVDQFYFSHQACPTGLPTPNLDPIKLKNAEHEVISLKTQLDLMKEEDQFQAKMQTQLDKVTSSQEDFRKTLEKIFDVQKDLQGSIVGLEALVEEVRSNHLKELKSNVQSLSTKQAETQKETANLVTSLSKMNRNLTVLHQLVQNVQLSETVTNQRKNDSPAQKPLPSSPSPSEPSPATPLTPSLPPSSTSASPVTPSPAPKQAIEPFRFGIKQVRTIGEEKLLFRNEWNSSIWRETKSGVWNPDTPLPIERGTRMTSYVFEDPESTPLRISLNSLKLQSGVFSFSLVFPIADTVFTVRCVQANKVCSVLRTLHFKTFKLGEIKIGTFQFGKWATSNDLIISFSIKKIKCDFFLEFSVPGEERSYQFLEYNHQQFCSNEFSMVLKSDGVTGSLKDLLVSPFHGSCVISSVCECHENWDGEYCNIPRPGVQAYSGSYETMFDQLIQEVQYPKDCSTTRALVFSWKAHGLGFGNSIHWMLAAFSYSLLTKRTFLMAEKDTWLYAEGTACPSRSWGCYFEPPSSCSLKDLGDHEPTLFRENTTSSRVLYTYIAHLYLDPEYAKANPIMNDPELNEFRQIPAPFHKKGLVWWTSQLLRHMWRLNPSITTMIETFKKQINLNEKYVGLHVRRGDKIVEVPNTPPEWYVDVVREYANRESPPIKSVFLATDDPGVLPEFTRFNEFQWFYNSEEKRMNGTTLALWEQRANGTEQTLAMFHNFEVLSRGEYCVTTLSSNFGRLILELRVGSRKIFKPCASLDWPYWDPLGKFFPHGN